MFLHNEIQCFNKVGNLSFSCFVFLMIYTYKYIPSISTIFHWVKSSIYQQSTVTECILNLLGPLTAGGGAIIFIDLVSTNILLAMLGFPLSQKNGMLISVLSPAGYFYFSLLQGAIIIYRRRGD